MIRRFNNLIPVAILSCFLAACDGPPFTTIYEKVGMTQAFLLKDGWAVPKDQPEDPVFCYRTIGGADCYDSPLPDQEHRLICDPRPPVE